MSVTDAALAAIMPNLSPAKRAAYLPHLNAALTEFEIDTPARMAAFLAQIAHESGQLRWWRELASGEAYEGRRDLGNTQPGDGRRYKGRGPIQLTGRHNYRTYGALLGVDLEGDPEQAATPEVGFRIAGLYWQKRGLNELADRGDFRGITKRINGGYRGLADRQRYWERAKAALAEAAQPITVLVNNTPLVLAGFREDGTAWVPLRAVHAALAPSWRVGRVEAGTVALEGTNRVLLLRTRGGVGYVAARALEQVGVRVSWDGEASVVRLEG